MLLNVYKTLLSRDDFSGTCWILIHDIFISRRISRVMLYGAILARLRIHIAGLVSLILTFRTCSRNPTIKRSVVLYTW